jgi:hypothetical protein
MDYALCGIPIRLDCSTICAKRQLAHILQTLFSVSPGSFSTSSRGIELRISNATEEPVTGEVVFHAPDLSALRTARGYHLRTPDSFLSLDLMDGRAEGSLSDAFLESPLEKQRGLWLLALLLLLARRGRYALHAGAAVSPDGQGVLLAGVSGSGKTTLTCALARSGWSYLSDDSVLLKDTPAGVEALAFGRPFHCAPAMFRHYPELGAQSVAPRSGKRLVEVASLYPGQSRSHAQPRVVLFPEIVATAETQAIPLSGTETLVRLLRNGAAKIHHRASMAAQMAVLAKLATSAHGYRLLHGADVHGHPQRVAALLQQLAQSPGGCNDLHSAA